MFHPTRSSQVFGSIVFLTCLANPVLAHTVETNGDVGVTFHIEPNHNPRAGETARAWFALTRAGGQLIPLEQCDCQLTVYSQPSSPGNSPILQPSLKAIATEQYQGIPGADIVFPEAGAYQLELSGKPTSGASFQPFMLKYNVNVVAGTTAPQGEASQSSVQSEQQTARQSASRWIVPAIVLGGLLGIGSFWLVRRSPKKDEG
jgi:hypothetical protein